ncbi:rust resistance kinase Lr10-like [Curcuma longa]|uniref:rust resistance kinase Lr10-like n=1 Tax=Curcuma longa TaxID=136217 RepID=UPI003D9F4FEB
MASGSGGLSVAVIIILVIFGGIIQLVIAILIIRCVQNMRKSSIAARMHPSCSETGSTDPSSSHESRIEMKPIEEFLIRVMKEKPIRFTPQNLEDFTQNFAEKLGSGGNGTVFKGQFPNGVQVAVKVLHGTSSKRAEEQFMAEVGTIGRTYHLNLVKLYGFCFEEMTKALVYEYIEKGSLDQYLFNQTQERIEFQKLYEIAVGTAKGIRYLHEECQQKIVHYDIKPANILITADFVPKIADFGLARLCERNKLKTHSVMAYGGRGTPGYAAPEMWSPSPVTNKVDVYSFGMLLLEMLGKRKNFDAMQAESKEWFPVWVWNKFEQGEMKSIIEESGVEEKDREKVERLCLVALKCIQHQPESRPTMNCVVQVLEGRETNRVVSNPFKHIEPYSADISMWSSMTSTTATFSTSTGVGSSS